jgi:hypothetical protein
MTAEGSSRHENPMALTCLGLVDDAAARLIKVAVLSRRAPALVASNVIEAGAAQSQA